MHPTCACARLRQCHDAIIRHQPAASYQPSAAARATSSPVQPHTPFHRAPITTLPAASKRSHTASPARRAYSHQSQQAPAYSNGVCLEEREGTGLDPGLPRVCDRLRLPLLIARPEPHPATGSASGPCSLYPASDATHSREPHRVAAQARPVGTRLSVPREGLNALLT